MKARVIRKKPKSQAAPNTLNSSVQSIFARYVGKTVSASDARKIVDEINRAVVDECCRKPDWQETVKLLHKQLQGKALFIPKRGQFPFSSVFFIEGVGYHDSKGSIDICISGLQYVSEEESDGYVRMATWYLPLNNTFVRNGCLHTHLGGCPVSYTIATRKACTEFLHKADFAVQTITARLNDF